MPFGGKRFGSPVAFMPKAMAISPPVLLARKSASKRNVAVTQPPSAGERRLPWYAASSGQPAARRCKSERRRPNGAARRFHAEKLPQGTSAMRNQKRLQG